MRYFYDTEFLDDGHTISLISIAMVCDDGREFYAVSAEMPWDRIATHPWLARNVVPYLPTVDYGGQVRLDIDDPLVMYRDIIAKRLVDFVGDDMFPHLWAYFAAYDHVALAQLFGAMIDLPATLPMWTHDIMQEVERRGYPKLPPQNTEHHHALNDARWVRDAYYWLNPNERPEWLSLP